MVALTGCGKREDASEAGTPAAAETSPEAVVVTPAPSEPATSAEESAETAAVQDAAIQAELAAKSARFLGEVLVSWHMGKKDVAVKQFLAIQWSDPVAFQGVPMLAMSEQQLASLSQQQQTRVVEESQTLASALRAIAKYVVAAGESVAAAGDTASAKAHYIAVKECGQALTDSKHLHVVQMVGKAMVALAQQKLDATS
jgi:hypothetical protein